MGELTQGKRKVTKILRPPEPADEKAGKLRTCAYRRVSTTLICTLALQKK